MATTTDDHVAVAIMYAWRLATAPAYHANHLTNPVRFEPMPLTSETVKIVAPRSGRGDHHRLAGPIKARAQTYTAFRPQWAWEYHCRLHRRTHRERLAEWQLNVSYAQVVGYLRLVLRDPSTCPTQYHMRGGTSWDCYCRQLYTPKPYLHTRSVHDMKRMQSELIALWTNEKSVFVVKARGDRTVSNCIQVLGKWIWPKMLANTHPRLQRHIASRCSRPLQES